MGVLEIQVLGNDRAARETLDGLQEFCQDVHVGAGKVVYMRPSVGSSLADVVGLTPLIISLGHLLAVPYDSALGQEHFDVRVRRSDEESRYDTIEMCAGDMVVGALLPHEAPWPHVMIHRATPREHPFAQMFTSRTERAFLTALRDAVSALQTINR